MKNFDRNTMIRRFEECPVIHLTAKDREAVFTEVSEWFPEYITYPASEIAADSSALDGQSQQQVRFMSDKYSKPEELLILSLSPEETADKKHVEYWVFITMLYRKALKHPTVVITEAPFSHEIFVKQICAPVSAD